MKKLPAVAFLSSVFAILLPIALFVPPPAALGQFGPPPHGPHGFHPAPPPRSSFGISIGVRAPAPVVAPYISPGLVIPPPAYPVDSRYPSEWQIALDPYGYRSGRFSAAAREGEAYLLRPLDVNANCLLFQAVRGIINVQYTPLSASVTMIPGGAQYWFVCIAYPRNVMYRPYYVTVQVAQGPQYPYGFQLISIDPTAYTDPNGYYVNSQLDSDASTTGAPISENVSETVPATVFEGPTTDSAVSSGVTAATQSTVNPYGSSNPYASSYTNSAAGATSGNSTGYQQTPNYTRTPYSTDGNLNNANAPTGTPTPAAAAGSQTPASRAVQSVLEKAPSATPAETNAANPNGAAANSPGTVIESSELYSDDTIELTPPSVN